MSNPRRSFLKSLLAGTPFAGAPAVFAATRRGYSHQEVTRRLQFDEPKKGIAQDELPTPCLILDLDRFESNIDRMSRHARSRSIGLRPHAKTHKCAEIARRQVEAGARGICVATLAEAEVMSRAGLRGVLITAEIVGRQKIRRLMRLLEASPDTMIVADHPDNVRELNEAASSAKRVISVLIDLDVGSNRTGVLPGDDALRLAGAIARSSNLRLEGICAYAGHSSHVVGFEARRASSNQAMSRALETRELLRKQGYDITLISGGSTGTYNIDSDMEGISELQVGSYVFMDVDYRRIGGQGGAVYDDFQPALHVLTTVIHRSGKKAIVDGGFKAFATDRKFGPELRDIPGVPYLFAGDEHGTLVLENASCDVALGERLEFIVPHCDPNVNLYDRIYGVRRGKVESVWPVMNRSLSPPYF